MSAERGPTARGYSLVEVIVALVLLQIGLLGAAGMVVIAGRAVAGAARTDRALTLAEGVADSLDAFGWTGAGERIDGPLVIEWSATPEGVGVEVRDPGGTPLVRIPLPGVVP